MTRRSMMVALGSAPLMKAVPIGHSVAPGVAQSATPMIALAANGLYDGTYSAADLNRAAVALRILADDVNAAGVFAKVDSQFRRGTVHPPGQDTLDSAYHGMRRTGMHVDQQTVERIITSHFQDAKKVMTQLGGGIHVAVKGAEMLEALASVAPIDGAHFRKANVPVRQPQSAFCHDDFSWYSGAVGAYLGIVALAVTGPVGIAIGIGATVIGLASLYTSC